jgi:hypothetical protein
VRRVRGAARAETVLHYGFTLDDQEIRIVATGRFRARNLEAPLCPKSH